MIGDSWNTLVAPPTDRELEAAMAEVRVRAIGHARRSARRGRMLSLAGVSVAMTLAVLAGARLADPLGIDASPSARRQAPEGPTLSVVREGVAVPTSAADPVAPVRFRVATWQELDGVRFGESAGFVEGPAGTHLGFVLRAGWDEPRERIAATVKVRQSKDSVKYLMEYRVVHELGVSRRHFNVIEEGIGFSEVGVARGEAVQFMPFGEPEDGEPATYVRIEGPDVPAPAAPVEWNPRPIFGWRNMAEFSDVVAARDRAAEARRQGARVGRTGHAGMLWLAAMSGPRHHLMRFSVVGVDRSVEVLAGGMTRFMLPGVSDTLAAWARPESSEPGMYCFGARRYRESQVAQEIRSGTAPFTVTACVPTTELYAPIETSASTGVRIRAQLLPATPDDVRRAYRVSGEWW